MMNRRQFILSLLTAAAGRMLSPPVLSAREQKPLLRIAVISDLNHSYGTIGYDPPVQAAIRRIIGLKPDLVLCTGDMIAGQRSAPKLKQINLAAMWHSFHETITLPLQKAGIPLAATPGNHDASALPGFTLERNVYSEQWQHNRAGRAVISNDDDPFYYAFSMNGVLFISLDATVTSPLSEKQMAWLKQTLSDRNRPGRACIVFGHIPLSPITVGRERSFLRDPRLVQLFSRQDVSLYLSGHHHGFYPFYLNNLHCVGQAALGSGPRRLIGTTKRSPRAFTWIEVGDSGNLSISAHTGPAFQQILQRDSLPKTISSHGMTITRDDLKAAAASFHDKEQ